MKVFIRKLSGVLEKAAGVLCATILAGLCLIIVYSVIMRSIFIWSAGSSSMKPERVRGVTFAILSSFLTG